MVFTRKKMNCIYFLSLMGSRNFMYIIGGDL